MMVVNGYIEHCVHYFAGANNSKLVEKSKFNIHEIADND